MYKMSRDEAVKFIQIQLNSGPNDYKDKQAGHYGKVELRELLDALYGEFTVDSEGLE